MDRKKRLFNRILLVSGGSAVLLFAGYIFFTKRAPRHYVVQKGYEGWVTVRYEKQGAPPLEMVDGTYQLYIPANGVLETSTKLEIGWARDDYFWTDGNKRTEIPRKVDVNEVASRYVHDHQEEVPDYTELLLALPDNVDTVMWDGTRISRAGDRVDVRSGRKLLEHFYVSADPQPYFYQHDTLPLARKQW